MSQVMRIMASSRRSFSCSCCVRGRRSAIFAGPEAANAKIDTITGEMTSPYVADLDGIIEAAGGLDAKVRKDGVRRGGVGNDE